MIPRVLLASIALSAVPALAQVTKPAAIVVDGVPAVPATLVKATQPYQEARRAQFLGWNPADRSMLIRTRFANTEQVHSVRQPGGERRQLSFEAEPILTASLSPGRGDALVVQKDVGGGEFYQLFRLDQGRLTLLTDGKSRNWFGAWSRDGSVLGYSSTRRNGTDADLYVVDPRKPASDRLVAQVKGGGWNIADFSPDGRRALVLDRQSVGKADLYELDLASGRMRPIGDVTAQVAQAEPHYAADGSIWMLSDAGSDVMRAGRLDASTGRFTPVSAPSRWDVTDLAVSPDGATVAYATNEAGISRLYVMDVATGITRRVDDLPAGVIPYSIGSAVEFSPWGTIGLSMSSARVAGDVFSIDPRTLAVTRWTESETGGLDPASNVEPELVEVKSFDGTPISGFLYRPDARRFPGKRPVIVNIHGGPEGQSRPDFLGPLNYLLNERGIAIFFPNVRGSSGYGKRFVGLDNGPFKREDTVRDIGVFLDALAKDAALDADRIAVEGVSYGGYMCYASATHYSARLKGANCYVAISNFVTFLQNTQSYRRDLRRVEYGDERDPKQRAKLVEISPLTSVGKIAVPLLVATGGNDPRVPPSEAEQMIAAVRGRGGQAWHLIAQNEGHVFRKKENEDYYFWASILFWEKTLLDGRR
jgi:dipeptidyl aminopeptidase/acylaminoacyl peptidase